jgi:hypothetical protein
LPHFRSPPFADPNETNKQKFFSVGLAGVGARVFAAAIRRSRYPASSALKQLAVSAATAVPISSRAADEVHPTFPN